MPGRGTDNSESCPEAVLALVERFHEHRDAYKHQQYKETQVRREFIDPFFTALGWDVDNKAGHAEAYKDVIHEDAIKIGGETKAPDYCFRIGGVRKFFVEGKKPIVGIETDPGPAYQLRRYAWTSKLPLSIVTDFEEFAVYDCRVRPNQTDKASTARVFYCTYDQYAPKWSEIASIFSKEAILKGSFDKFAESNRRKRGTAEVDNEFLKEIESWREALARNVALRNPDLSVRDLNFAVTRIIDRIIFLRMCEDRGIEEYGRLRVLPNAPNVYRRLVELFYRADERYNSGLFHFEHEKGRPKTPDELTPKLTVDDKVLKDIIRTLYYPQCPYEFAVLPAEILGHVYEQFLGKVIRLTKGHRAKIEEKPEVKKAGGVYYTPTYIVDYIVKHTVGKLLDEVATPKKVSQLHVLDPACGSGSFLLGAYQYLLDWHLNWYTENDPEKRLKKKSPPIYQSTAANRQSSITAWRLTVTEKKRILLNNIYGVDIDSQAVEVTKLSLLLKVLEGESHQTLDHQLRLFHERALPDLGNNIKCGNSLIGPDFYDNRQMSLLDDDEECYRINVFDWHAEFPDIMRSGGFDAVIGNPPWGGDIDRELRYFHARYPDATRNHTDSFKLFIARCASLVNPSGCLSMIVPSAIIRQRRYKDIRTVLLQGTIGRIVDLGEGIFPKVVAPSCIFLCYPRIEPDREHSWAFVDLRGARKDADRVGSLKNTHSSLRRVSYTDAQTDPDVSLAAAPLGKLSVQCIPLGKLDELQCKDAGINYQRVGVGMEVKGDSDLGQRLLYEGHQEREDHQMFWKGGDLARYYAAEKTNKFCRVEVEHSLRKNEVVRLAREVYAFTPKILLRQTADRPLAVLDTAGVWFGRSVLAILPTDSIRHNPAYFLGLLNSRYLAYLYRLISAETGRVFAQVKFAKLKQLPIRTIVLSDPADKSRHDRMVELVERMLSLHKQVEVARTPTDKTAIQRQIDATDRQIDQLVYELYGVTDEEIKIVEEAAVT
jgi:hypothetical protein